MHPTASLHIGDVERGDRYFKNIRKSDNITVEGDADSVNIEVW